MSKVKPVVKLHSGLLTLATSGLSPRAEPHLIRGGATMIAAGGAGLAAFVAVGPPPLILLSVLFQGLGFGICWPFVVRRILVAAEPGDGDLAASSASSTQRIGYALGSSASGIAANAAGLGQGASVAAAHAAGYSILASFLPVLAIGTAAAWRLTRP